MAVTLSCSMESADGGRVLASVWLDGAGHDLDRIESVRYLLHPSFADPVRTTHDRSEGFRVTFPLRGDFLLRANLHYRDGSTADLRRWLASGAGMHRGAGEQAEPGEEARTLYFSCGLGDAESCIALRKDLEAEKRFRVVEGYALPASDAPLAWALEHEIARASCILFFVSDRRNPWMSLERRIAEDLAVPGRTILLGSVPARRGDGEPLAVISDPADIGRAAEAVRRWTGTLPAGASAQSAIPMGRSNAVPVRDEERVRSPGAPGADRGSSPDHPGAVRIRNIAIIAHAGHGKTTLVGHMLRQAGAFRESRQVRERVMDSNPLERERGITILAKNLSVRWGDTKINIVDTPGHSGFGGEVERILRMVDGVVLLVDAAEGPMPQTRFVTRKALELGLQPVVVINKIDRGDADPHRVHDEVLELFMELEADDHQLDCPFLYAIGREGVAMRSPGDAREGLKPLFETILETMPAPKASEGPFQMLVSTLDYSPYLGRLAIGKIERGTVRVGDPVVLVRHGAGAPPATPSSISRLYTFEGLERREAESAFAGDVVALSGFPDVEIGATLCDAGHPEALEGIAVEEPTVSVDVMLNNSPFSGREGKYVPARKVHYRLLKESESDAALRVEGTDSPDTLTVSGRGELHLGTLLETMRREGYEFAVSRPRVIFRKGADGQLQEPYEELTIDVPETLMAPVIEELFRRRCEMLEMKKPGGRLVHLVYRAPARALLGYRGEFLAATRGEGTLHHRFVEYGPYMGAMSTRRHGVLVSIASGVANAERLAKLQERSTVFIEPGTPVYEGMIVGERAHPGDMEVDVTRGKELVRGSGSGEDLLLEPPRPMTLEDAMSFVADDELIEVTPGSLRLRKRVLEASRDTSASRAVS